MYGKGLAEAIPIQAIRAIGTTTRVVQRRHRQPPRLGLYAVPIADTSKGTGASAVSVVELYREQREAREAKRFLSPGWLSHDRGVLSIIRLQWEPVAAAL